MEGYLYWHFYNSPIIVVKMEGRFVLAKIYNVSYLYEKLPSTTTEEMEFIKRYTINEYEWSNMRPILF